MIADPALVDRLRLAFSEFRRLRPELGVGELLTVLKGPPEEWGPVTETIIRDFAALVWCTNLPDRQAFQAIWETRRRADDAPPSEERSDRSSTTHGTDQTLADGSPGTEPASSPPAPDPNPDEDAPAGLTARGLVTPEVGHEPTELVLGGPVARRGMVHALRRLRRTRRTGVESVLDTEATIQRACEQGFYLGPVLSRRHRNAAELLLLLDQEGSMVPFHRLTRDLLSATAECGFGDVSVFYFHDVFDQELFVRETLQSATDVGNALRRCAPGTFVVIVSDAGAARGSLDVHGRIVPTLRVLDRLFKTGASLVWLNPLPARRWEDTSAEYISRIVPMHPMTQDGFGGAVAALRGVRAGGG